MLNDNEIIDYLPFPSQFLEERDNDLFVVRAEGDGMLPTIEDNEIVIFRKFKGQFPPVGKVVLCKIDGQRIIKRITELFSEGKRIVRLTSDNKNMFRPIMLDDKVEIIGVQEKMRGKTNDN